MLVFSGLSSGELAAKVINKGGFFEGPIERNVFPDGELYLRIGTDIKGDECTVVSSIKSNNDLVDLLLLLDALRDQGAGKIIAVLPYLTYARQDKIFVQGEGQSAKTVVKLISGLADEIWTMNCHFLDTEGEGEFKGYKIKNLDGFPLLGKYFTEKLDDPVLIAPDKGSLEYAKRAANIIGCEFDFLSKKRISSKAVEYEKKELDVAKKDVLILDDIISTGGTIISAANFIRKYNPASINVGCVHGVFATGTRDLKKTVDRLICTDTIQRPESKVSVAELIAEELRK
ncbi:MAG: ribose-phosphate diphosphokinase [Candidatus Altiarchaeota archaeon]